MTEDERVIRASEARMAYQDAVKRIRDDRDLSPQGRSRAIAREWVRAERDISEARESWVADQQRRRASYEEKVLRPRKPMGLSASEKIAIDASFRDALDRAERAESAETRLKMLRQARHTGDDLQERAVVVVALDRKELEVLRAHVDAHPEEKDAVEALIGETTTEGREQKMAAQIAFGKPALPRDAGAFTEFGVRQVAADQSVSAATE